MRASGFLRPDRPPGVPPEDLDCGRRSAGGRRRRADGPHRTAECPGRAPPEDFAVSPGRGPEDTAPRLARLPAAARRRGRPRRGGLVAQAVKRPLLPARSGRSRPWPPSSHGPRVAPAGRRRKSGRTRISRQGGRPATPPNPLSVARRLPPRPQRADRSLPHGPRRSGRSSRHRGAGFGVPILTLSRAGESVLRSSHGGKALFAERRANPVHASRRRPQAAPRPSTALSTGPLHSPLHSPCRAAATEGAKPLKGAAR